MEELRIRPSDIRKRVGVDSKTLRSLIDGSRAASYATRWRVEEALDWPPGEIERLARGGEPTPAPPSNPSLRDFSNEELIAELAYRLGRAANQT